MNAPLHCAEGYCDLHDYQINMAGICLRQDALRRSENMSRSGSHDNEDLAGAILRLGEILERMERRQPNWSPPQPVPQQPQPPRTTQRKGGTPL